jgi:ADP-heptose:LPS heptosyltransferase
MAERGNSLLRWADYFLGVPLAFFLSLGKIKNPQLPPAQEIHRIGLLATAAIGDTILLSAVLQDLKATYPHAELVFFAGGTNSTIARMCCPQDKIITLPVSRPDQAIRSIRQLGTFDLWIDFGPWPRINALLSAFAKARMTIGFRTPGQARHFVYDRAILHRNDQHELENLRDLVTAAGVHCERLPELQPTWSPQEVEDYVLLHMVPGGYLSEYKEWSPANWISLINGLTNKGYRVRLSGAPVDRAKTSRVAQACQNPQLVEDFAGQVRLPDLPNLLAKARLIISVNTGIMHMAAAVQAPLIALHGPTSVKRWGPVSDRAVNFESTSQSAGCLDLGFEYDREDKNSLDTISPISVLEKALEILNKQ